MATDRLIEERTSETGLGWQTIRVFEREDGSRYTVATPLRTATQHGKKAASKVPERWRIAGGH